MTSTKLEDGRISFDLGELIELLPIEKKLMFIESLACSGDIIKHVTAQILDGWTENMYHGPLYCTAAAEPVFGLDWAKRQIALRASEVASEEIKRLQQTVKLKDEEIGRLLEINNELRHEKRY